MRNYPKLDIVTFGKHLIKSGDLDPLYSALPIAIPDKEQLKRWCVAYWCFYNAGFASYASEFRGNVFYELMFEAAENETLSPTGGRWPRGKERRHARGKQGMDMVHDIVETYNKPELMVDYISEAAPVYTEVASRVQTHVLFGPWISFKVADMLERVLGHKVDFTEAAVFMFADPVKGALMFWRQHHQLPENAKPKNQLETINQVVEYLRREFAEFSVNDRRIGLQEIETVLCKWKSHMNGHYPLNNDIDEIGHALDEWSNPTAIALKNSLPKRMELC